MDRRAAGIATAVTVPVVVVLALAFGANRDSTSKAAPPLDAPITSVAPGLSDAATVNACVKVLSVLPVQLDDLNPRVDTTERSVAWGPDPAVVLRCGVPRPTNLVVASTELAYGLGVKDQVFWLPNRGEAPTSATVIDRAVYIEVSGNLAHLPALSDAIASVLPAVCVATQSGTVATDKLCTHRK